MKRSQVAALKPSLNSVDDALAALVQTQHKDFKVRKQEWAVIRIQAVFYGFLIYQDISYLNADLMEETNGMEILPYMAPISKNAVSLSQPLMLFGTEIMKSSAWPPNEEGERSNSAQAISKEKGRYTMVRLCSLNWGNE
ncbi:hypothetical protein C1H46_030627 [Malus baccata]|uniref:Uncharacterized protein n=1 Tax=Malus baccata TaxID=106549 RepID=A0A540LBG4_MALBA|nr:hypothetical protein C1H46_030627 [Malus baccata]